MRYMAFQPTISYGRERQFKDRIPPPDSGVPGRGIQPVRPDGNNREDDCTRHNNAARHSTENNRKIQQPCTAAGDRTSDTPRRAGKLREGAWDRLREARRSPEY